MKNTRSPLFVIQMILCAAVAHAGPEVDLAFKGGPDVARLSREHRLNRYGFSGGLAGQLQWPLTDRFSLAGQLDLLYTGRGTEMVIEDVLQGKVRQHYLDVVVAARPAARLGWASVYLLLGG